MFYLRLIGYNLWEHLENSGLKILLNILNRVQVRRVRRLVYNITNASITKLVTYFISRINRCVILYKEIAQIKYIKYWLNLCVENLDIRVRKIPMLLRLKISVHYIQVRTPKVPKGSLDHNLYILIRPVYLYLVAILFLCRRTKHLFRAFTPPPLY